MSALEELVSGTPGNAGLKKSFLDEIVSSPPVKPESQFEIAGKTTTFEPLGAPPPVEKQPQPSEIIEDIKRAEAAAALMASELIKTGTAGIISPKTGRVGIPFTKIGWKLSPGVQDIPLVRQAIERGEISSTPAELAGGIIGFMVPYSLGAKIFGVGAKMVGKVIPSVVAAEKAAEAAGKVAPIAAQVARGAGGGVAYGTAEAITPEQGRVETIVSNAAGAAGLTLGVASVLKIAKAIPSLMQFKKVSEVADAIGNQLEKLGIAKNHVEAVKKSVVETVPETTLAKMKPPVPPAVEPKPQTETTLASLVKQPPTVEVKPPVFPPPPKIAPPTVPETVALELPRYPEPPKLLEYQSSEPGPPGAPVRNLLSPDAVARHVENKRITLASALEIPPKTTIVRNERQMLAMKLREQARGAKAGYRYGRQEAKAETTEQWRERMGTALDRAQVSRDRVVDILRMKADDIGQVKKDIVEYVNIAVPVAKRGLFLNMAANAKTQGQAIKAFVRADKVAAEYRKNTLISRLNKLVNYVADSPSVAVDYRAKIKELTSDVNLKKVSAQKMAALRATELYMGKAQVAGDEINIPLKIAKAVENLQKRGVEDITVPELENMIGEVDDLAQLGRTKLRTMQNLYNIEKARKTKEVLDNIVPIEKQPMITPSVGSKLTKEEKFKNVFPRVLNSAQHVDMSITPVDVFADMMDGSPGSYDGAFFRTFKKTTDVNFGKYLDQRDAIKDKVWEMADKLNLKDVNFDRIGIHAARMQKNGISKLIDTGYTPQEIDAVKLTKPEMEFYAFMRRELDSLRNPIADVMRRVYNKTLGAVEEYFPFLTDWKAMSDSEVFQRVGEGVEEIGHPTKNVEQGFTKERTKTGRQKIQINAMDIFLKHTDNVAYLLNMARDNKMLFEIANSPEFGAKAGDFGQRLTLEWLDTISRKGGATGDSQIAALDVLRRNLGAAALGFKLSSAVIQPTALMDGATMIGRYVFKGLREVATNGNVRAFVLKNMPEVRNRVADDRAFLEFSDIPVLHKAQELGYGALKWIDSKTAAATGYGAYMKKMNELGQPIDLDSPNPEAIYYAQLIVRRTQASALFKDAPPAIARGKLTGNRSFDRALLQFQTFMLNRWSLIRHDLYTSGIRGGRRPGTIDKDFGKAFNTAFWLTMAVAAETGIRRASKELISFATKGEGREVRDDDGFSEGFARNALQTIPFMSQTMSMAAYNSDPIPALDALRETKEIPKIFTAKQTEQKIRALINAAEMAGRIAGIPGTVQAAELARSMSPEIPKGGTVRSVRPGGRTFERPVRKTR